VAEHRCSGKVSSGSGWGSHQCSRKASVEEGGKWWCKQHLPSAEKARRETSEARWKAQREADSLRIAAHEAQQAHAALCVAFCADAPPVALKPGGLAELVAQMRRNRQGYLNLVTLGILHGDWADAAREYAGEMDAALAPFAPTGGQDG